MLIRSVPERTSPTNLSRSRHMTKERKTNRKSPRARVDQAELGLARFNPSFGEWAELERRIEKELNDSDRALIAATINNYNLWYYAEQNAAFLDQTLESVIKAKRLLSELAAILTGSGLQKFDYDSLFSARSEIALQFSALQITRPNTVSFNALICVLEDASIACVLAERELTNGTGIEGGESWRSMINEIRTFLKSIGAATGISNSSLKPQPFVDFVMYLSKIENGPREHVTSAASLAKAIQNAGRNNRRKSEF